MRKVIDVKVCVYGLGAIGGLVAARLARAGTQVSAVARGATLAAVRERGLVLDEAGSDGTRITRTVRVEASEDPAALGPQDLVVIAVKATALDQVAGRIAPLMGPDTVLLPAMNGVPWWFFHGLDHGLGREIRLEATDPGGRISAALPAGQVLGTVLHLSASVTEPGVIRHGAGDRVILGEPLGTPSTARLDAVAAVLRKGGFDVETTSAIQREVWFKLWGNMTMNPLSAVTGATLDRILDDPEVRGFATACMREAAQVGARIGLPIDADPEQRHAVTRELGAVKTSMLQDAEAGRAIELDALVGSVAELARAVAVPTPNIDTLLGLTRLSARVRGLLP
ncbi:2-dehydropantoate 2-reductase [Streptomyces sp. NPDC002577]